MNYETTTYCLIAFFLGWIISRMIDNRNQLEKFKDMGSKYSTECCGPTPYCNERSSSHTNCMATSGCYWDSSCVVPLP